MISKKKIAFISLGTISTIFVGLFIWAFVASSFSMSNCTKVISGLHFSCLIEHKLGEANCLHGNMCKVCGSEFGEKTDHLLGKANCKRGPICSICDGEFGEPINHDYSTATCIQLATCSMCGETTGDYGEHTWKEATCTKGQECELCAAVEGEPLGHNTDFGKCFRCGEIVGVELYADIADDVNNIDEKHSQAMDFADTVLNSYSPTYSIYKMYFDKCIEKYSESEEWYDVAIEKCGSFSGLSKLKSKLKRGREALPLGPVSASYDSIKNFVLSMQSYSEILIEIYEEIVDIGNKLNI